MYRLGLRAQIVGGGFEVLGRWDCVQDLAEVFTDSGQPLFL